MHLALLLILAITNVELDVVNLPLTNDIKMALAPAGRSELKREGTVTRVRIDIDRVAAPGMYGGSFVPLMVNVTEAGLLVRSQLFLTVYFTTSVLGP